MIRSKMKQLILSTAVALSLSSVSQAQSFLIENATVHTMGARGTLQQTDVLIENGLIKAIGVDLAAPTGVAKIDAKGLPLTPGLFGGLTALGLEEVSGEVGTVDNNLTFPIPPSGAETRWRPEFDVVPAFNPKSAVIQVNRVEGLTYSVLSPSLGANGSFVAGQGAAVRLNGDYEAAMQGSRSLFINLGSDSMATSAGSRAAQYMLLDQAIGEVRAKDKSDAMLLTAAGRDTMAAYMRGGRVVVDVDRAADILQVIKLAKRYGFKLIIAGGAEAWMVADQLAAENIPVAVDALANLPGDFDSLGSRLDNAALLQREGVQVLFSQAGDATHNARKIRQLAGNAAANGMDWNAALAGITRTPAEAFGVANQIGKIEVGMKADLVLWSGDPLEVTEYAVKVWIDGKALPMQSRQTLLRDRYMRNDQSMPVQYPASE